MEHAAYVVLLAKACPGLFDHAHDSDGRPITPYDFIRDHLPYAQGHALLHAAAILDGHVMTWPDLKLSKLGRWWLGMKRLFRLRRRD